jgi:hypothetical protein
MGALAVEAGVSGASSEGTLSEGGSSSAVLDPGVRRLGLPQEYHHPDNLRDSPGTATTDTHTGRTHAGRYTVLGQAERCAPGQLFLSLLSVAGELQPMASSASVASLVIAVETGLSDEEGSPDPSPSVEKS